MDPFERTLIGELPSGIVQCTTTHAYNSSTYTGVHFRPYPGAVNSLIMLWEFVHMDIHVSWVLFVNKLHPSDNEFSTWPPVVVNVY